MNKARRKQINDISNRVAEAILLLTDAQSDLEGVRDEEQESFDNLPEGLQQSEQGSNAEAAIEALERAIDAISTFLDEDALSILDEAQA